MGILEGIDIFGNNILKKILIIFLRDNRNIHQTKPKNEITSRTVNNNNKTEKL